MWAKDATCQRLKEEREKASLPKSDIKSKKRPGLIGLHKQEF